MVPLGTQAPPFHLPATDGKSYSLDSFGKAEVLVVIFICNHCPYVKATLDRFIALQKYFSGKSVQLVGINPNDAKKYPEDDFPSMKRLWEKKGNPFPYLMDESQSVARAYQAVCTPDIFVYNRSRQLAYRGRLDDNWQQPDQVQREDLKSAIQYILEHKNIPFDPIPSMGCSIKWRNPPPQK
jgi:peroxiredoxin